MLRSNGYFNLFATYKHWSQCSFRQSWVWSGQTSVGSNYFGIEALRMLLLFYVLLCYLLPLIALWHLNRANHFAVMTSSTCSQTALILSTERKHRTPSKLTNRLYIAIGPEVLSALWSVTCLELYCRYTYFRCSQCPVNKRIGQEACFLVYLSHAKART